MFQVVCPERIEKMEQYYRFRWEVLYKPLQMPYGSERDAYDAHSIHRMIQDQEGQPIAVGRLFVSDNQEALIKHLAVDPEQRQSGLGSLLLMALERAAHDEGVARIVVNARGDSLPFFSRCGFEETTSTEFDKVKIKRQQMVKELSPEHRFVRQPKLCTSLQEILNQQVPLSERMGLKLKQYTGNELITQLPLAGNHNPHQSMFAGSIYSLAVLSGWSMVWLMLQEHGFDGDIVLAKGEIKHRRPIAEDAVAKVNKREMKGSLLPLLEGKKVKMTMTVGVYSGEDKAAEFQGVYLIVPNTTAS